MDSPFPPRAWDGVDDVVIVGGGFSGLICALTLTPRPVTVITAGELGESSVHEIGSDPFAALVDATKARPAIGEPDGADGDQASALPRDAALRIAKLRDGGIAFERGALGSDIMRSLCAAARRAPSIRVMTGFVAEQLRAEGDFVTGLIALDRRGGLSDRLLMPTRAVVLATGGIGMLYDDFPTSGDRGEGLAMAARAGALIADPELIEFTTGSASAPFTVKRHRGGIHVDAMGRTTLDGLWACGETACSSAPTNESGPELALAETLVIAARAADDIKSQTPRHRLTRWAVSDAPLGPIANDKEGADLARLRSAMREHVGPVRDRGGVYAALAEIAHILAAARTPRMRNAAIAARLITAGAVLRLENSSGVAGRDHASADAASLPRTFLTLRTAERVGRTSTTREDATA